MRSEYDFKKGRRGAVVPSPPGKTRITIRLDTEVVEHFKRVVLEAGGGNYQTLINEALLQSIGANTRPVDEMTLRKVLRKVLREELRSNT